MIRRLAACAVPFALTGAFTGFVMCGSGADHGAGGGDGGDGGADGSHAQGHDGGVRADAAHRDGHAGADGTAKDGATHTDAKREASAPHDAPTSHDAPVGVDAPGTDGGATPDGGASGASVLQFHKHLNRDGFYIDGALTKAALGAGTLHLDATFDGTGIVGEVRASPLYVENGIGGKGTFYVATESNNVYAFDETTGKPSTPMKNLGVGATTEPCGEPHTIGIRGTPAIDVATRLMVLDAATADGQGNLTGHTIYGLSIDDLSIQWSLDVSTLSDATVGAFSPVDENQRSAVLIVGGIAYVTYGGFYGDCGGYHGWVVGVPLGSPTSAKAYATPAGESGIWAVGGASSDGTNVYVATGNGDNGAGWAGAFSVLRMQAGPVFSGQTSDYWVAINDTGDTDLGGSGPLVVTPAGSPPLVVQLGKDGYAYLIDTTKPLGGSASPLASAPVMDDEITCGPASATIAAGTFVAMVGNNGGSGHNCPGGASGELVVITVDPSNATMPIAVAWCADGHGGGSPMITTSDGNNDALLWAVGAAKSNDPAGSGDNQLHAWDLATGTPVVTGSDPLPNVRHFTTPIVVHGRIFVLSDAQLYALTP